MYLSWIVADSSSEGSSPLCRLWTAATWGFFSELRKLTVWCCHLLARNRDPCVTSTWLERANCIVKERNNYTRILWHQVEQLCYIECYSINMCSVTLNGKLILFIQRTFCAVLSQSKSQMQTRSQMLHLKYFTGQRTLLINDWNTS